VTSILACCCVAFLGSLVSSVPVNDQQQRVAWLGACVCVVVCSLLAIRSTRVIGRIEAELIRCFHDRRRWQVARPIVGRGMLIEAWNDLLHQADSRSLMLDPARDDDAALVMRGYRSLPYGIAITDSAGNIVRHNPAFKSFALETAAVGTNIREAFRSPWSPEISARLQSGIRFVSVQLPLGQSTLEGVLRLSRTRLEGRPDDPPGCIWMVEDITQATLAAEARDQFLTTATHELRTPLANLKAYAEVLISEENVDLDQQKEFCNIIHDECSRVARLVDQLLAVGQLEAGSLVLARGEVDLGRVIREAFEYLQPTAAAKRQTLRLELPDHLPVAMGDKDKLQAMLVNLLGNAIKYTQVNGSIELIANTSTANRVDLSIVDNGPGIAASELPHIFEKFYRSQDPQITAENGNGLGLTFAREIARLHGGDVSVESRLGEGCRFTVQLPVKPAPASV
jgi:signal transduction histidine kinase